MKNKILKESENLQSPLAEKFSRNIPDWVIQHIDKRYSPIKDKLSRTIDLNTAEWEPIDKNNITTKDISNDDPDKIRIFRLDFAHDNKFIYTYIPGYEDGSYVYLPRDGKYHYISKMAKKDIVNAIIDGGVLTCDSQALSKKRQDRADAKKGSINRGIGQFQRYDYAKNQDGTSDFSTKIYNNKWYNSRGQDKSGYEQVDYLKTLARKLTKMDKDNYKIIMNKMKTSIDEAKDLFIQLLKTSPEKLAYGTTNRDRWDSSWMRVAYDTNSTLKDLIKEYEDIDKTIKRSEEKGNIEDTISYLNDGYYNLGEIRKNLGNLSMNLKSMIDELSRVDESFRNKMDENLNTDIDTKAKEVVNPVYADAIKGIKRADKAREEYRKLPKAEVREENPKVKGNSDMKKMYLSESLFEDTDFTYEGDYIVTVYSYRDGSYKTYIEQCNDNHEAAAWFDELNQMTDDKLAVNGIDGFAWLTIDDDGTTVIVDERISGYADTNAVQKEIDYYVNTKQQNESLNESTSNVDINKLSNFIKNAVNSLTKNDEGTWYFHLVDNLYYVIGAVNPENYDKEDLKILALSKDGWVICGKIAVNIDDMQSDYELDWYMPYEKDGEVWDTERDFYKNDDYTKVAQDIIRDLHNFDNVTVDKNGEIITNKITDEACKSKKRVKKQLKEDSEIHVFDQIPDEDIYDQANYVFSDDGLYGKDYTDGLIIGGNRDYSSIIYSKEHKDEIKDLLYSGYSSDEIVQELNKITGKTYVADQISGYSQSDWNNIYYPTGEFSNDYIRGIEDAYFGKYTAYDDGNELVVVFDSDRRPVKEIISDQTGIPVNQIKIRKFTGYTRIPNYEDDED